MRAGILRHRVTIEQATEVQDSHGEPDITWSTFATRWMLRAALPGRELFAGQQVYADIGYRFECRYLSGVVPKMRLKQGSRVFNIHSVQDDGRKRRLVITASEAV